MLKKQRRNLLRTLILDSGEEEGWGADIRLSITEIASMDSSVRYEAVSSHEGNVGVEFDLPKIKSGTGNSPTQTLTIRTCRESSDKLLAPLSKLYKVKTDTTKHLISSAKLAFVDLNEFAKAKFGKNAISATDAKERKLFFETENPDDYAELYVNIKMKRSCGLS
jgi:hypothetical protein